MGKENKKVRMTARKILFKLLLKPAYTVILAKAGIQKDEQHWISVCTGMTANGSYKITSYKITTPRHGL